MSEGKVRQAWLDTAAKENWVRERKSKHPNDHPRIAEYNKVAKSSTYAPYCAAGLYFTARKAGLFFVLKHPAAVRSWFDDKKKTIYDRRNGRLRVDVRVMDVAWLFQSHIEGIAQPIRRDIEDDDFIQTIAFNSGRNNQGVHYPMWRQWRDVRRIANHVTPYIHENQPK